MIRSNLGHGTNSFDAASLFHLIHCPSAILLLPVILRGRLLCGRYAIVACYFIFVMLYLTIVRGAFVILDTTAGDRWPLFQKCKIAERLVFIELDLRCCDLFFSNGKDVLTNPFIHLPILICQNVLEKSFQKFHDVCSQDVDLCIGQRLLHLTVYRLSVLLCDKFTKTKEREYTIICLYNTLKVVETSYIQTSHCP